MAIESALKERYDKEIVPALMERFKYKNPMQVPKMVKVVVNMGVGDAVGNPKLLDAAVNDLAAITGQKPLVTRAKKSIASFKVREGMPIGAKVTLRGQRMYDFIEKLFYMALPRVRDFRGLSTKGFDGRGGYTLGVKEQIIFPEVDYDKVEKLRGMDITIVTSATTDEEAKLLLTMLGMPFTPQKEEVRHG
jgi:large subunit ribosomal protein L5